MFVKLTELKRSGEAAEPIVVNPDHVVMVRDEGGRAVVSLVGGANIKLMEGVDLAFDKLMKAES